MTIHHKAIELRDIVKAFDGRPALAGAHFEAEWGEVHALLGENGAGKSTLMNVACGLYAPDQGEMIVGGVHTTISKPADAARHGIGMVHQHYRLVPQFTVAENILLACGQAMGVRRPAEAAKAVREKAAELNLDIDPNGLVGEMSVAEQQRVEILKMLLLGARILILDEPTAVLTDREAESVLSFLRGMARDGCSVILITHKLREVMGYADRVTVMRGGKTVMPATPTGQLTRPELARAMVGESAEIVTRQERTFGPVKLRVVDLIVPDPGGGAGAAGVNFQVRGGEIYGIAGVGGNGQPQLVDALIGLSRASNGRIELEGKDLCGSAVRQIRERGLRFIPADRFTAGLIADFTVAENFAITEVPSGRYGGWLRINRGQIRDETESTIQSHSILGCRASTTSRLLSGGNAQKLLIAREMGEGLRVIVAHSPTRGLDVQARNTVHRLLLEAVEAGAACVLVSEELEEILALSDTVAVMSRGRIVGELPIAEATRERIGEYMLGHV